MCGKGLAGLQQLQERVLHDILRFCAVSGVLHRDPQQHIIVCLYKIFKPDRFHPLTPLLKFEYCFKCASESAEKPAGGNVCCVSPLTYKTTEQTVSVHKTKIKIKNNIKPVIFCRARSFTV